MDTINTLSLHEKILIKLFEPKDQLVLFDIGACEGLSSLQYSKMFPKCVIYAFEPVPNNYEIILKNKKKYELINLIPYQLGLSSKIGTSSFFVSSGQPSDIPSDQETDFGNKSSSLFPPDKTSEIHPWLKFDESITIETETLDNFCKTHEINSIDFIHMDVQGAELMVLKGGHNMLTNIKSIWLEVERVSLYKNQPLKNEIASFLQTHNYTCIISELNHVSGDQLWVKKSHIQHLERNVKLSLFQMKVYTHLKSTFVTFFYGIRYKLKLRTRLRKSLNYFTTINKNH